jgi:hypothetical protein
MCAIEQYRNMTAKSRAQVLLAEYRCGKRCLLLHVWQTPHGRHYYQPPYRLSPEVTEAEAVESARRKRTVDGYRKWQARAGSVSALPAPQGRLPLGAPYDRPVGIASLKFGTGLLRGVAPGRVC